MFKRVIKSLLPPGALGAYHRILALLAAARYGNPSQKLVVIGVTGTNGKTTTSNMLCRLLEGAGKKVGLATTANFRVAGVERLNATKMTMLGRFQLQKLLAEMVAAGCEFAVIETSSEGIAQWRHAGIAYDVAVFTNLTPEHLESHGGFENYKAAKLQLFRSLATSPRKRLGGRDIPKVSVVNLDSPFAAEFLAPEANKKYGYSVELPAGATRSSVPEGTPAARREVEWPIAMVKALDVALGPSGAAFTLRDVRVQLRMPGMINVENATAAMAAGLALGLEPRSMAASLADLAGVPGRQELVDAGQPFTVMVDYSHEPEAFRRLYEAIAPIPKQRIIQVIGSAGGGRDKARRSVLGRMAGERADVVIVTDEDPYDEDPGAIIAAVAGGARGAGKRDGTDLFVIPDRREALAAAVGMARPGDFVLATGKGAEQWICVADGHKVPWDERAELRKALESLPKR